MSKEFNVIEATVTETPVADQPEMIKLDDLSLILVGGGSATVVY